MTGENIEIELRTTAPLARSMGTCVVVNMRTARSSWMSGPSRTPFVMRPCAARSPRSLLAAASC